MMIVIAAMASKAGAMMRTRVFMPANIAGDKKKPLVRRLWLVRETLGLGVHRRQL